MKLVIDLQGAQAGNRHKGIGRYTLELAKAMARAAGGHDLHIVLNGSLADTVEPLRAAFDPLIPQDHISVWNTKLRPLADINHWRWQADEILREAFLASLKPDLVHVTSPFEGICSVGRIAHGRRTAVTLYDLIPLIHQTTYLVDPESEKYYRRKLSSLRRAGLWLAISDSACREGFNWLGLPPDKVSNISAAADASFRPLGLSDEEAETIRRRYGLTGPFVLYVSAADKRKNFDRLFGAFGKQPKAVRRQHQLLIVGPTKESEAEALRTAAKERGLEASESIVVTHVPDDDLVALYNLCTVFCIPSLWEGFGLPALEAMQCGAPTIGSNTSSLPEVIGRADALFDPYDEQDIACRLYQVLTDAAYRRSLAQHGLEQARKFTWEESARRAWVALEAHHAETREEAQPRVAVPRGGRPRLAYVSPLPPERSGIADYSAELLPELARYYDIDVVVDQPGVSLTLSSGNYPIRQANWFDQNAHRYDRVLYHFGNTHLHRYMVDLLDRHPGVVVLHDFNLRELADPADDQGFLLRALYYSHGYPALQQHCCGNEDVRKYPANFPVLRGAIGVIVPCEHSRRLARECYGDSFTDDWRIIPSLERPCPCAADQYHEAVENFYEHSREALRERALAALAAVVPQQGDEQDWHSLARGMNSVMPDIKPQRQLLVNVSGLNDRDGRSGIERLTRGVLKCLLASPPTGYRVEPIYAVPGRTGYYYAREFALRFLGCPPHVLEDAPVELQRGDVFLGLGLHHDLLLSNTAFFIDARQIGVEIDFVVYDLLPMLLPHAFVDGMAQSHARWLSFLASHADGLACISRSVAEELIEWLNENAAPRLRPLRLGWFPLGSDVRNAATANGTVDQDLTAFSRLPSFLMVGTIEPRKCHAQVLAAFELLWKAGKDVNLVIVGEQGWMVDTLAAKLRAHPELGKRLFWLDRVNDGSLEAIYAACACLISPSEGEGFGLPLIEAARHKTPILARDIPVFREVAGEHATYFSGKAPFDLFQAVESWLALHAENRHAPSEPIAWLTWAESTERLKEIILKDGWQASWPTERELRTHDNPVPKSAVSHSN